MAAAPIAIVGKSGQVAHHLQLEARRRGLAYIVLSRPEFDLADPAGLKAALKGLDASAIINAAAYTAVDAAEDEEALATRINGESVGILAEYAAEQNIPFLHISTDYVFDGSKSGPYVPSDQTCPLGAYGRSKRRGEELALAANPRSLIFRTAWVYSETSKNFLLTMLRLFESKDEIGVVADQFGCPTWAGDIASSLLDVLATTERNPEKGAAGIYHMTGSGSGSWYDFACEIKNIAAEKGLKTPSLLAIGSEEFPTPTERPKNSVLDCTSLERDFAIKMPAWQTSLRRCMDVIIGEKSKT